jgi:hypothetical protein
MLGVASLSTVSNFKAVLAGRCLDILSRNEKPPRQTQRMRSTHEDVNLMLLSARSGNFNFDMAKTFSNDTAVLCTYLEQRFLKRDTFHKFSEPALNHPLYRDGDSMCEEVCMCRKQFNREFAKVGVKYTSKSAYSEAVKKGNPFREKVYLSYYDRDTNLTHYFRNDPVADILFPRTRQLPIEETKTSLFSRKLRHPSDHSESQQNPCNSSSGRYVTATSASPLYTVFKNSPILREDAPSESDETHASNDTKTSVTLSTEKPNYNSEELASRNNDKETVISRHANTRQKETKPEEKTNKLSGLVKSMLSIWKNWVGKPIGEGDSKAVTKDLAQRMETALNTYFGGDLEEWAAICIRIARSKYLMGEGGSNWNGAYLSWVLKSENLENIMNKKGFVYDDRELLKTAEQQQIELRQRRLGEQRADLMNRKETLASEISRTREVVLKQAVSEITDTQKAALFPMFIEEQRQKGDSLQIEDVPTPWNNLSFLEGLLWTSALSQWVSTSLFQNDVTEEVEQQLLEEKTADRLMEVEQELEELAIQYRESVLLCDAKKATPACVLEDDAKIIATDEKKSLDTLSQKPTVNFYSSEGASSVINPENIDFRNSLNEILGLIYIPSAYSVSVFEAYSRMNLQSLACEERGEIDKKYAHH